MKAINTLSTAATASSATTPNNVTQAAPATIPSTCFSYYHVVGDGDCLFRAMHMGLSNQPGIEPSHEQVMGLRQYLANYVYQHQQALIDNPAFEGQQGVQNLYDLLLTPGQWNHNAGDLVAPLLAQVSGRTIAVLQPTQEGTAYSLRQLFSGDNSELPPGNVSSEEPSICLAHINGNHYGYLEARYPNALSTMLDQAQNSGQPMQDIASRPVFQGIALADREFDNRAHKQGRKKRLRPDQEQAVAQLWLQSPGWGYQKMASEFKKRYPDTAVSAGEIRRIKHSHKSLQGLKMGAERKQKKLSDAREREVVDLWQKNASWNACQIANEINKRHPDLKVSHVTIRGMLSTHPLLRGITPNKRRYQGRLNASQEMDLAQIWRANPHWGERKVLREYLKHNPGVPATKSVINGLKRRHPVLRGLKLGADMKKKKLSDIQEQQLLQLCRENPSWANKDIAQEYARRHPENMPISRALVSTIKARNPNWIKPTSMPAPFDIPEEDVLSPRTLAALSGVFNSDDFINEANTNDNGADEDSRSQGTFSALSDIAALDELSNTENSLSSSDSDDGSLGFFEGLDDFEHISRISD